MGTVTIAEFLNARLDEDEQVARRNIGAWPGGANGLGDTEEDGPGYPDYQTYRDDDTDAADAYIRQFRPLRALADIEADQKLLAAYAKVAHMDREGPEPEFAYGRAVGLGEAVRMRAARFAGHPDYRPEWAPER